MAIYNSGKMTSEEIKMLDGMIEETPHYKKQQKRAKRKAQKLEQKKAKAKKKSERKAKKAKVKTLKKSIKARKKDYRKDKRKTKRSKADLEKTKTDSKYFTNIDRDTNEIVSRDEMQKRFFESDEGKKWLAEKRESYYGGTNQDKYDRIVEDKNIWTGRPNFSSPEEISRSLANLVPRGYELDDDPYSGRFREIYNKDGELTSKDIQKGKKAEKRMDIREMRDEIREIRNPERFQKRAQKQLEKFKYDSDYDARVDEGIAKDEKRSGGIVRKISEGVRNIVRPNWEEDVKRGAEYSGDHKIFYVNEEGKRGVRTETGKDRDREFARKGRAIRRSDEEYYGGVGYPGKFDPDIEAFKGSGSDAYKKFKQENEIPGYGYYDDNIIKAAREWETSERHKSAIANRLNKRNKRLEELYDKYLPEINERKSETRARDKVYGARSGDYPTYGYYPENEGGPENNIHDIPDRYLSKRQKLALKKKLKK